MTKVFFISDMHFNHKNILEFEGKYRPFKTIEEHDQALIERWNSVVTKRDKVFVLGDFSFGKGSVQVAKKLNGSKTLIMGNHDLQPISEYAECFDKVYGAFKYKGYMLTHIPIHRGDDGRNLLGNIHGHMHSRNVNMEEDGLVQIEGTVTFYQRGALVPDPFYLNVSIEQLPNLQPILFEDLINR